MSKSKLTSRIPGFHRMTLIERRRWLEEQGFVPPGDSEKAFSSGGLPEDMASSFIENCVGSFSLPVGIATNFLVDGQEVLIPMAVEESSVVAAASHGAKLARGRGGFFSDPTSPVATCQVEFFSDDEEMVYERFSAIRGEIAALADRCHPRLLARGGGVRRVDLRSIAPGRFVIHIDCDTQEAMGANIVNTIAEAVGRELPHWIPCRMGLRILTNLTTHRLTHVHCEIDPAALALQGFSGEEAMMRIVSAWEFADLDPFRAATHNKGIMNGIDPVVIATGNDWRAVEAGCHAFASLSGQYRPLTTWSVTREGRLRGEITVPVAIGTVGGVTRLHPGARAALGILGNPSSARLSAIVAAVGLAQNLSALRALACEGIQRGHMALHEKNLEMMRREESAGKVCLP